MNSIPNANVFYSEVGSQYWCWSRKIFIQALIMPNSNCFLIGRWSVEAVIWYLATKLMSALDAKLIRMCFPTSYFHTFFVHILITSNNKCSLKEHLSGWSSHGAYLKDQFQLLMRCYLPLVFGFIMLDYLCHDCGKSQLFFSGRISEQALTWDISA